MSDKPTRTPDFVERYANNVTFDMQGTDITIEFGVVSRDGVTESHTAIRLSWAEAKIIHYLLGQNLTIYEGVNGEPIQVPRGLLPKPPTPPTEESKSSKPWSESVYDELKRRHEAFAVGKF